MKILLTLPRPLFPPNTGGRIRSFNIFSRLARQMEIHAVSLADRSRDTDATDAMRQLFASYTPVYWNEVATFSPRFYANFLKARFSPFPYFLAKYRIPEFHATVTRLLREQKFDLLLCDFLQSAAAVGDCSCSPRVLFEHNVEYVIRKRHWETETNALRKAILEVEWRKARKAEDFLCRRFDHVICVSAEDRAVLSQEFGLEHVSTLSTGVDVDYFRPQQGSVVPGRIVFVGSMDWYPNEQGAFWFVREVLPLVRRECKGAHFVAVGRNPSARLRALADQSAGFEITGTVEDVRPFLSSAQVVVVPLRVGGGTRIKIYEAMAMERAVVSTSLGAEGLPVIDGRDLLLADDAASFANAILAILQQDGTRQRIGRVAREKVVRDCGWGTVANQMADILRLTLEKSMSLEPCRGVSTQK